MFIILFFFIFPIRILKINNFETNYFEISDHGKDWNKFKYIKIYIK